MKTPEEIKKGLKICYSPVGCGACPYRYNFGNKGNLCVDGLMRDAHAYIEQLESQIPRWIPVEERLPENRDWVLVIGIFVPEGGWFVPQIAEYYSNDWRLNDDEHNYPEDLHIKVTHWMPLPEPPPEKKGE